MLSLGLGLGRLSGVLKGIVKKSLQLWLNFTKSEVIGSDVIKLDFNSDWTWYDALTVNDSNSFTTTDDGTIRLDLVTKIGKVYDVEFAGTTTTTGTFRLRSYNGGVTYFTHTGGGSFSGSFQVTASTEGFRIRANTSGVTDITTFTVKEALQFVKDKSPNTNNATLFTGKAMSFDGVNDYVDIDGFTMSGDTATFAFWMNSNNTTGRMFSANPVRIIISYDSNQLSIHDGAWRNFGEVSAGEYHRVVITINGTTAKCFVNGVQLGVDKTINPIDLSSATTAKIGSSYNGVTPFFNGNLSDFQIYNKAWTEPDVAFDYNNPNLLAIDNPATSLVVTDLKAYWALSEGDGLVAYDSGSTLEEDVVQNGDFSELGIEKYDGNITSPANGGTFTDNGDGTFTVTGLGTLSVGIGVRDYNAEYLVVDNSYTFSVSGSNTTLAAYDSSFNLITSGVGSVTFVASTTSIKLYISPSDGITSTYSNVSVKQVDPNDEWVTASGAGASVTIKDGRVDIITNGDAAELKQTNIFEVTKRYQVTVDAIINSGAGVKVGDSNDDDIIMDISSTGVYTAIFVATGVDFEIAREGGSASNSTINSVSITEITQSAHGTSYDSGGDLVGTDGDFGNGDGSIYGATYVDKQDTIPQLGMMDWVKRSNLYLNSEPTANEGPAGNTTYGSYAWGLNGFSNATIFGDNSVARYRYGATVSPSVNATLSCYIIMDDLSEPEVGINSVSGDFSIIIGGTVGVTISTSSVNVGGNVWRISKTADTTTTSLSNNGIIKNTTQSAKGFKVVGWQIEESSSAGNYILTDGEAAIDVTTVENPMNKGYDILGNALRLRENAFNLDGSGYAEVVDNTTLDFGTGDFTVAVWATYKFEKTGSGLNVIISNGTASSSSVTGFNLLTNSSDYLIRLGNGTDVHSITIPGTPVENEWNYIAFKRVGTTLTIYVNNLDGVEYVNADIGVNVSTTTPLLIGRDEQTDRYYKGLIDEPTLYNRPLSQKEITNNYNIGLADHS